MPRIRKKTSNRQNTRDRAKITKKVSEHKRKTKRNAKKDVTWKSKKKVDPGVPSTFPYKDRVLAELAEEKRRNEEAKQARREANKVKLDEPEDDTPGIASLASSSVLTASASIGARGVDDDELDVDEADIPELVDTALATLQDVIDKADVVVQVLDARDIQGGRSEFIEKMVTDAGGKFALIVNKIDLVPRETLAGWLPHLPIDTYLFSSKLPADPSPSTFPGRSELLAAFQRWSTSRPSSSAEPLTIALMGLPNVGKSSLLNALLPSSAVQQATAPVYPTAAAAKNPQPTTLRPTEVVVHAGEGVKVHVIDTPGWEYAEDDDDEEDEENDEDKDWDALQEQVVSDMLRRNLGRIDRVKDVLPLVEYIFKRSDPQDLMLAYNVPYFTAGDLDAFLLALARANGRVRKHGDADIEGAARIVVRDWATGAFPYFVKHPNTPSTITGERADVSAVLDKCRTRKELRAVGKGLIKFKGGEIDTREVILDDDFIAMAEPSDDDEDDEDDGEELDEEDDEDDEEDEEEDDDDDDDDEEDEEGLVIDLEDGEELDLEDGPEPSSGSDVPEDDDEEDDDEEEGSDEGEEVEKSPTPPPVKASAQGKRKRKSDVSVVAAPKKAKRVSFGKNEVRVMKDYPSAKGQNKRKRG